jgi:hypothetical protein
MVGNTLNMNTDQWGKMEGPLNQNQITGSSYKGAYKFTVTKVQ